MTIERGWQFWIDRGGTFTDVIARHPGGGIVVRKLLSDNPGQYGDAAVAAIESILANDADDNVIDAIKMGTTVGTNALLERRGEPTVLAITAGFGDALRIGYQNRPDIFALDIRLPELLHGPVIEVDERVTADGRLLRTLAIEPLREELSRWFAKGFRSIAVCLMHGWRAPEHERVVGELALAAGYTQVSLSHEVLPLQKIVSRGDTTVVDAYLSPILRRYIDALKRGLRHRDIQPSRLMFMQSNGGLVDHALFRGKDCILSGPAGGLVGMVNAAGEDRLIGFDMGGTSTDVSLYADDFEFADDFEIDGVRIRAPIMRIHTIAAGGGSVLKFESGRFQVGPESAGANPGPRAYRRNGPLTVTDANIQLGRIVPGNFPNVFGARGDEPLDQSAVSAEFCNLSTQINTATGRSMSSEDVAEGFVRIAVDNMANAIKHVSIQRGFDASEFNLCCFGGAGGQHACAVADELGITKILIHPLAGVLSAYGIGTAPNATYAQHSVELALTAAGLQTLASRVSQLQERCRLTLKEQGFGDDEIVMRVVANIRVTGTNTTLPVVLNDLAQMRKAFSDQHRARYGFLAEDEVLHIESLRVDATARSPLEPDLTLVAGPGDQGGPRKHRLYQGGSWHEAAAHSENDLAPGDRLAGPAIITGTTGTTVVDPGWTATVDGDRRLSLERSKAPAGTRADEAIDPILLEVFNNHFMHIAEQMGVVLENTAYSVNIKERLDFSCALFDTDGHLIANAPHIPVHLGSMGDSVQTVLRDNQGRIRPGDVFMLNSPYAGGSHLPDITVVTPVFDASGDRIDFVVGCRAHHADIGGQTPGSMPPFSKSISDEGVVFENFRLVSDGTFQRDALCARLGDGPNPARNIEQNVADLRAQVAANEKGVQLLHDMVAHFGLSTVKAYMRHVQDNAEEAVREVIDRLSDGQFSYRLDDGLQISVRVVVDRPGRSATIDFSGTSAQSPGNFNAPVSITRAAVMYVFRSLVARQIPLNAGCLRPLSIEIPAGSLLNPSPPAAVAAGNVETSQCVTNALYAALGIMAASQGTMNNVTFGDNRVQYYETLCGGAGAGANFDGASAVHTHMTNSRITDPEVLETRLPVLLHEFSIRRDSGGAGRHRGGNGARRVIEFLGPMRAAVLSNHRDTAPAGLQGGANGKSGQNTLTRADGSKVALTATAEIEVKTGDRLTIETPGGGGFGKPD